MSELIAEQKLTVPETAQAARCCEMTVRRAIAAGELPALRMGRKILIAGSDLETYLKRNQGSALEATGHAHRV